MKKITSTVKKVVAALLAFILIFLGLMAYIWFGVLQHYYNVPNELKAVEEYDPSSGLVDGDVYQYLQNSERSKKYELGVNEDGDVVFCKPRSAFNAIKRDTKEGWHYVDRDLDPDVNHLSKTFYEEYIRYADEEIDSDENADDTIRYNMHMLSSVLKIYENSFYKHR